MKWKMSLQKNVEYYPYLRPRKIIEWCSNFVYLNELYENSPFEWAFLLGRELDTDRDILKLMNISTNRSLSIKKSVL